MKNVKSLLAALLLLALALNLCACGGEKTAETEAPAATEEAIVTEAPAETEAAIQEEGGYTVTVVDENGSPIAGAMVQMCKDTCYPGVTDENGVVKFSLAEDEYKVSFLALPAGFTYVDDVQEFYFAEGSMELTITLKAAA